MSALKLQRKQSKPTANFDLGRGRIPIKSKIFRERRKENNEKESFTYLGIDYRALS